MKKYKSKHPATSPISSLLAEQNTSSLIVQAQQSKKLERLIKARQPLRGVSFDVGPMKQDKLKLFVGTPAAITRLRQSLPSLIEHIQAAGWNINHIQLQIQTSHSPSGLAQARTKQAVFSPTAQKAWLALESRLHDPVILEATRALYKHHKLK